MSSDDIIGPFIALTTKPKESEESLGMEIVPREPGAILFCVNYGKEVLRLEPNGDIYVKGNFAENDKQVVDALREFLTEVKGEQNG